MFLSSLCQLRHQVNLILSIVLSQIILFHLLIFTTLVHQQNQVLLALRLVSLTSLIEDTILILLNFFHHWWPIFILLVDESLSLLLILFALSDNFDASLELIDPVLPLLSLLNDVLLLLDAVLDHILLQLDLIFL